MTFPSLNHPKLSHHSGWGPALHQISSDVPHANRRKFKNAHEQTCWAQPKTWHSDAHRRVRFQCQWELLVKRKMKSDRARSSGTCLFCCCCLMSKWVLDISHIPSCTTYTAAASASVVLCARAHHQITHPHHWTARLSPIPGH